MTGGKQEARSLLPPRVAHKRQSSYGGSGSGANINAYLVNVTQSGKEGAGIGAAVEEGDNARL